MVKGLRGSSRGGGGVRVGRRGDGDVKRSSGEWSSQEGVARAGEVGSLLVITIRYKGTFFRVGHTAPFALNIKEIAHILYL